LCLASMAATVSLPSGSRTGGFGASAKAISTSASLEGSPGWLWLRPPATVRTFPASPPRPGPLEVASDGPALGQHFLLSHFRAGHFHVGLASKPLRWKLKTSSIFC
jgi:hypothetical protein